MADTMMLASEAKWLRKAAEEIRDEGHPGWGNTCEFAADAIDAAIKQREQDAKDAARYRWLKENDNCDLLAEDVIDEAIGAMAKESGNG